MTKIQISSITTAIAILALFISGISGRVAIGKEADTTQQRIDRLDSTVQAAEGVRAIKRLHYSYAHYLESGLWNDVADLFTDEASGEFPAGMVRGKDNLQKYFMQQAGRTSLGL